MDWTGRGGTGGTMRVKTGGPAGPERPEVEGPGGAKSVDLVDGKEGVTYKSV